MATRYDNFSVFMAEVTRKTKQKVLMYGDIWKYIILILEEGGWLVFLALCALLALGPLAFAITLATVSSTPFALILAAACAGGSGTALWAMYRKRELPLAVREVGNNYKTRFAAASSHDEIDRLLDEASNDLLCRLTK